MKNYGEITFASKGLEYVKEKIKGTGIKLIDHLPERTSYDGTVKFTVVTLGCKTKQEFPVLEMIESECMA